MKRTVKNKFIDNLSALGFLTICGTVLVSTVIAIIWIGNSIGIPLTVLCGAIALAMIIGVLSIK